MTIDPKFVELTADVLTITSQKKHIKTTTAVWPVFARFGVGLVLGCAGRRF